MADPKPAPPLPFSPKARRWSWACLGLILFCIAYAGTPREEGLWLPAAGVALAWVAWQGFGMLPLFAAAALVVQICVFTLDGTVPWLRSGLDPLLLMALVGVSWWVYRHRAKGALRLDDPKSAVVFLILVPGIFSLVAALLQGAYLVWVRAPEEWGSLLGALWISRALGFLLIAPFLLVLVSPWLIKIGILQDDPTDPLRNALGDWTWGEIIETAGLTLGNCVFTLAMVHNQVIEGNTPWPQWGLSLLVVIWASLRQGLRGGVLAASLSGILALALSMYKEVHPSWLSPFQGNLLIQASTALLVGASAGWIRASEARYRLVVGHMPVVLFSVQLPRPMAAPDAGSRGHAGNGAPAGGRNKVFDLAQVTLVSPASRQVLDCEPESLLGPFSRWLERVDPQDHDLILAAVDQLRLQKRPVICEYRMLDFAEIKADSPSSGLLGQTPSPRRWVRATLAPNYNSEGLLAGWEGVVEDITEQRRLAHDLRRLSTMLQALITHLPTGVFFVQGPNGYPILVNTRARQLLGKPEDPSIGIQHLSRVYHLQRRDGTPYPPQELPVAKALIEGISSMANDIVIHHPDGRIIPLITWAAPIDLGGTGKADAAVWVLEDLTPVQQAEQARKESEILRSDKERYQKLVDTLPLMVLQFDAKGNITLFNTAVQQITGYEGPQLRQPGFWLDLVVEEERDQFRIALSRTLEGYQTRLEFQFRSKEGTLKAGHGLLQPHYQGGAIVGSTAVIVDMTFQRRLEEELRKAQRLELVGKLAGGTVHDFNNLLTVMIGLTYQAMSQLPADHEANPLLGRVLEAGEQASHLAGQILAFSKQRRAGTQDPSADINTAVRHSLKLLRGVLPSKISVEANLLADDVHVKGEENQLKQVVMNLCFNARDAMPQGGTLTLRTELVAAENHEAPAPAPNARWLRFIVQDTGHGMDAETLDRIFDPFFSTKERGTGLGLAVVRQIVESFGGFIRVASQPNQGTRMEVWLQSTSNGQK